MAVRKILLLILLCGALLRLIYVVELGQTPFFAYPILDAQYYTAWAEKLSAGNFSFAAGFQGNPLYPYFLALLYYLFGPSALFLRLIQHGLGLLTVLLLFFIGKKIFSPAVGLLAGLFYALFLPAIFYEGWFLTASLAAFLTTLLLALIPERPSGNRWFFCGIGAGLLTLARPSLIPLALLVWIFLSPGRRKVKTALLFLAGFIVILLPYSLQYHHHWGDWVLVSAHGGENFYLGNNPRAQGSLNLPDFARGYPSLEHDDFIREAERRSGEKLTPAGSSRFWFYRGLRFISSHPGRSLKLFLIKDYLLLSGTEISDNYQLSFFQKHLPLLRLPFTWRLLSSLGILGMILLWKKRRYLPFLYLFTFAYLISVSLFFVTSRLRLPLSPIFCLFAAGALHRIAALIGKRQLLQAGGWIGGAVGIFLFLGIFGPRTDQSAAYLSAGEVYYRAGDYRQALFWLNKAQTRRLAASRPAAWRSERFYLALGKTYLALNDLTRAESAFNRLLGESRLSPGEMDFEIGNAYAARRLFDSATKYYRRALEQNPKNWRNLNNLGLALKAQGEIEEARRLFQEAIKIKPDYAAAHVNLGNLYLLRAEEQIALKREAAGKKYYRRAAAEFQRALKLDPGLSAVRRRLERTPRF